MENAPSWAPLFLPSNIPGSNTSWNWCWSEVVLGWFPSTREFDKFAVESPESNDSNFWPSSVCAYGCGHHLFKISYKSQLHYILFPPQSCHKNHHRSPQQVLLWCRHRKDWPPSSVRLVMFHSFNSRRRVQQTLVRFHKLMGVSAALLRWLLEERGIRNRQS